MDLIRNRPDGLPVIRAYGGGGFRVGESRYAGSLLITPAGVREIAAASLDGVAAGIYSEIATLDPPVDILFVGTGPAMLPLPASTTGLLRAAGTAVEVMATGAACRTFNLALAEGRRAAALLIAVD